MSARTKKVNSHISDISFGNGRPPDGAEAFPDAPHHRAEYPQQRGQFGQRHGRRRNIFIHRLPGRHVAQILQYTSFTCQCTHEQLQYMHKRSKYEIGSMLFSRHITDTMQGQIYFSSISKFTSIQRYRQAMMSKSPSNDAL